MSYWLALSVGMATSGGVALADQPPSDAAPQHDRGDATTGATTPDDEFIEFLGSDDVGDAAWWEFLKKSAPQKDPSPDAPRDTKP